MKFDLDSDENMISKLKDAIINGPSGMILRQLSLYCSYDSDVKELWLLEHDLEERKIVFGIDGKLPEELVSGVKNQLKMDELVLLNISDVDMENQFSYKSLLYRESDGSRFVGDRMVAHFIANDGEMKDKSLKELTRRHLKEDLVDKEVYAESVFSALSIGTYLKELSLKGPVTSKELLDEILVDGSAFINEAIVGDIQVDMFKIPGHFGNKFTVPTGNRIEFPVLKTSDKPKLTDLEFNGPEEEMTWDQNHSEKEFSIGNDSIIHNPSDVLTTFRSVDALKSFGINPGDPEENRPHLKKMDSFGKKKDSEE